MLSYDIFINYKEGKQKLEDISKTYVVVEDTDTDKKEDKKTIRTSQSIRTFFVFVMVVIGVTVPSFSIIATIIPLFFPRVAIALRPLWKQRKSKEGTE